MKKYINILLITFIFSFLALGSILLDKSLNLLGENTWQILFRFASVCFILFFLKDKNLFDVSSKGKVIILIMSVIPIGLVIYLQAKYVTNISITNILLDLLMAISEELIFRYIYITVFKSKGTISIQNMIFVALQYIIYSIIITIFITGFSITNVLLTTIISFVLEILYMKNSSLVENVFLNFLLKYLL